MPDRTHAAQTTDNTGAMAIEKMVVLSTKHVPQDVREEFSQKPLPWVANAGLNRGWLITVPATGSRDLQGAGHIPRWLARMLDRAATAGAQWLMLSHYCPLIADMPVYSGGPDGEMALMALKKIAEGDPAALDAKALAREVLARIAKAASGV